MSTKPREVILASRIRGAKMIRATNSGSISTSSLHRSPSEAQGAILQMTTSPSAPSRVGCSDLDVIAEGNRLGGIASRMVQDDLLDCWIQQIIPPVQVSNA
jgi:hypothetical protein